MRPIWILSSNRKNLGQKTLFVKQGGRILGAQPSLTHSNSFTYWLESKLQGHLPPIVFFQGKHPPKPTLISHETCWLKHLFFLLGWHLWGSKNSCQFRRKGGVLFGFFMRVCLYPLDLNWVGRSMTPFVQGAWSTSPSCCLWWCPGSTSVFRSRHSLRDSRSEDHGPTSFWIRKTTNGAFWFWWKVACNLTCDARIKHHQDSDKAISINTLFTRNVEVTCNIANCMQLNDYMLVTSPACAPWPTSVSWCPFHYSYRKKGQDKGIFAHAKFWSIWICSFFWISFLLVHPCQGKTSTTSSPKKCPNYHLIHYLNRWEPLSSFQKVTTCQRLINAIFPSSHNFHHRIQKAFSSAFLFDCHQLHRWPCSFDLAILHDGTDSEFTAPSLCIHVPITIGALVIDQKEVSIGL